MTWSPSLCHVVAFELTLPLMDRTAGTPAYGDITCIASGPFRCSQKWGIHLKDQFNFMWQHGYEMYSCLQKPCIQHVQEDDMVSQLFSIDEVFLFAELPSLDVLVYSEKKPPEPVVCKNPSISAVIRKLKPAHQVTSVQVIPNQVLSEFI